MSGQSFLHEHREFPDLLTIVSEREGVAEALVEKDYWVTHTLWALREGGLRVYFKGGTSLSKGFGLIERFSEDLDLKLEAEDLPPVTSWTSEGVSAVSEREAFFRALGARISIPGAGIEELSSLRDRSWRHVVFAVRYPAQASGALPEGIRPFVQLEVGSARTAPGGARSITSWVHDHVFAEASELAENFVDNRPEAIHCVSPRVTLMEKIEAATRRFSRPSVNPASFVRHYEDIVRILDGGAVGSPGELADLLSEMQETKDIRHWPSPDHAAWNPHADPERWESLEKAWAAIAPIFWGDRVPLKHAASRVRRLLEELDRA